MILRHQHAVRVRGRRSRGRSNSAAADAGGDPGDRAGRFRYGIAQSKHRSAYEAWLKSQLPSFDILTVTEETAVPYAALRVTLKRSGRPILADDAWNAALALQHRLSVLSRDERFDVVPGLEREGW